jgi:hypothetical protein
MYFLNAANWLRTSIPVFATIFSKLRNKLDEALGLKKSKRSAKGIKLSWTSEELKSFHTAKKSICESIKQAHPNHEAEFLLMTDASDKGWSVALFQCLEYEASKMTSEQKNLEALYFLSGTFKNETRNWAINEKEAFPIIEAIKRLRHLLLRPKGFRLFCDHKNLVYLFSEQPGIKLPSRSKLLRWALELQAYKYSIEHIDGDQNIWADIMSRWLKPEDIKMCAVKSRPHRNHRNIIKTTRATRQPNIHPLEDLEWPSKENLSELS